MTDWKVMSFNVRQMDGEDGAQSWEHRKDVLIETIRLHQPDLLATQETWDEQAGYILAHFPHYRAFGRGRFGDARDKHNKVFYDGERMELLDTGEIWISRSPHIPGSKDWDIPSPRMITWGLLRLDGKVDLMRKDRRTATSAARRAHRRLQRRSGRRDLPEFAQCARRCVGVCRDQTWAGGHAAWLWPHHRIPANRLDPLPPCLPRALGRDRHLHSRRPLPLRPLSRMRPSRTRTRAKRPTITCFNDRLAPLEPRIVRVRISRQKMAFACYAFVTIL
jgi:hypothetical protein